MNRRDIAILNRTFFTLKQWNNEVVTALLTMYGNKPRLPAFLIKTIHGLHVDPFNQSCSYKCIGFMIKHIYL